MAILILTVVIVLVVVGCIALLSPEDGSHMPARVQDAAQPAPLADPVDRDESSGLVRIPGYYLDWVDAAAHGVMFNLTGNDDEPGFYI